jgi:photosystem II stability/assembly factor-like uncharacterized protein
MRWFEKCRTVIRFALTFSEVLALSGCVASHSGILKNASSPTLQDSRVRKIADLPETGAWRHLQFVDERNCFFSTPDGIWRSSDSGVTWQFLHRSADYQETIVKVTFLDSNLGWMETHAGWLRTEDAGQTWQPFVTPLASSGGLREVTFISKEIGWIGGAALRTRTPRELKLGVPRHLLDDTTGKVLVPSIYRTDDGGKTWQVQNIPSNLGEIDDIQFINSDQAIAIGGPEAFHTRDGGRTWLKVADPRDCVNEEDGGDEGQFSSAYLLDSSVEWVTFDNGRMLNTTDGGKTWSELKPCDETRPIVIHFLSQKRGYGLDSGGLLFETMDGGHHWLKISEDQYSSMNSIDKTHLWMLSNRGLFQVNMKD